DARFIVETWPRTLLQDPRFSELEPPLPDLPALPIDAGWVDLYLIRLFDVHQTLESGATHLPYDRRYDNAHWFGEPLDHVVEGVRGMTVLIGHPGSGKSTLL